MKYLTYYVLLIATMLFACQSGQKISQTGTIVFDTLGSRPLQIYLPPEYDAKQSYPVVYMHDGQNLFFDSTSYAGEWGVDEVLDDLILKEEIAPLIIVGIYNSPQRAEEYVPYNDERILEYMNMDHWDGSLHMLFADFLTFDLFPYVEEKYGASNQKTGRALIGSSFGGVQAFWMGINYPEYFDLIGAMSPSVWVDQGAMIREVHSYDKLPDLKIWIDIGSEEYDPRCSELVQNLHQKGLTYGKKLWYYEHQGATHHESSWRERIANPLLLFKGMGSKKIQSVDTDYFAGNMRIGPDSVVGFANSNLTLSLENGVKMTALHLAGYFSDNFEIDSVGHILSGEKSDGIISFSFGEETFEMNINAIN
jgi:enterochelin esterase-like enzyme